MIAQWKMALVCWEGRAAVGLNAERSGEQSSSWPAQVHEVLEQIEVEDEHLFPSGSRQVNPGMPEPEGVNAISAILYNGEN